MQQDVSKKRAWMPSPAMIIAIVALIVALGGTALARGLGKNSVGTKQLRSKAVTGRKIANNAVNGTKVANGSLSGADINLAALGTVPSANTSTAGGQRQHRRRARRCLPRRNRPGPRSLLRPVGLGAGREGRRRVRRMHRQGWLPARSARTVLDLRCPRSRQRHRGKPARVHRHVLRQHVGLRLQHDLRLADGTERGRLQHRRPLHLRLPARSLAMARMIRRKRVALGAAVAVVALGALVLASSSQAVRVLQGKIVVVFEGTISPSKLPRTGTAPVGVQMGGKIKTTDGTGAAQTQPDHPRHQPQRETADQGPGHLLARPAALDLLRRRKTGLLGRPRRLRVCHLARVAPRPGRLRLGREAARLQRRQPWSPGDLCPGRLGCAAAADLRDRLRRQEQGRDLRHLAGRDDAADRVRIRIHLGVQPAAAAPVLLPRPENELRLGGLPGAGAGSPRPTSRSPKSATSSPTAATSRANSFASAR